MEGIATESSLVRVNGLRIYCETYGKPSKGTLLVLHGGPGISHGYPHPLAGLAQFGYQVILYDQLGCGRLQKPRTNGVYDFRKFIDEVEGFRRTLKLGRIHLLGHSCGTQMGTAYALEYPHTLKCLILAGPVLWVPGGERAWTKMMNELPSNAKAFWIRKNLKVGDMNSPRWRKAYKAWEQLHILRGRLNPSTSCNPSRA